MCVCLLSHQRRQDFCLRLNSFPVSLCFKLGGKLRTGSVHQLGWSNVIILESLVPHPHTHQKKRASCMINIQIWQTPIYARRYWCKNPTPIRLIGIDKRTRTITLTWHCMGDTSLRLAGLEIVANVSAALPTPTPPGWCCAEAAVPLCPFEVLAVCADVDAKLPLGRTSASCVCVRHNTYNKAQILLFLLFMTNHRALGGFPRAIFSCSRCQCFGVY